MCRRLRQLTHEYAVHAERRPRQLVDAAADEVPQRMAAEHVAAEQHDVDRRARSVPTPMPNDTAPVAGSVNQNAFHTSQARISENAEREEQQVAVDVLQDERKRVLAAVARARLADGAGRRIGPERLVVGAAVVVAGQPEERRDRQDQQRRRERQPGRPRRGLRSEPAVRRRARKSPASRTARDTVRRCSARPGTPPRSRRRRRSTGPGTRRSGWTHQASRRAVSPNRRTVSRTGAVNVDMRQILE